MGVFELVLWAIIAAPVVVATAIGAKLGGRRELYRGPAILALIVGAGQFVSYAGRPAYGPAVALVGALFAASLTYGVAATCLLIWRRARIGRRTE